MPPARASGKGTELDAATKQGPVRGVVRHGVRMWLGIPFAQAPVGGLRFRAPRPLPGSEAWTTPRRCERFGPAPVQVRTFTGDAGPGYTDAMGEDCLSVNVMAPRGSGAGGGKLLPVLVWVYGGAFAMGSSGATMYARGDRLVKKGGVVFVSFNYRVAGLGFSDFSAWSCPGGDLEIEPNLGLKDQVAALTWVRDNIAGFGGDPNNVTLFGESAGGMSVVTLMCIPQAAGLFHRVFAQSPAPASAYHADRHKAWASGILKSLGLNPDGDKVACARALKTIPAEEFVRKSVAYVFTVMVKENPGMLGFAPRVEEGFLPMLPIDAFRQGMAHRIPLVIGTMAREAALLDNTLPLLPTTMGRFHKMMALGGGQEIAQALAKVYAGFPSKETAVDLAGDVVFWFPSVQVAEGHAKHAPTWMYRVDYAPPLMRAAFGASSHALDVALVFAGKYDGRMGMMNVFAGEAFEEVSRRFQGTLLGFAKGQGVDWGRYEEGERVTMVFEEQGRDGGSREVRDPNKEKRLAWGGWRPEGRGSGVAAARL